MAEPLEIARLAAPSRAFAHQLLHELPQLRASCTMAPIPGLPDLHLVVRVASPVDIGRSVVLWMESGDEPSLAFGRHGWHVHETYSRRTTSGTFCDESLIDLLRAILADEVVLFAEDGAEPVPFGSVLDLREPDALLDVLTRPHGSGGIRILTFTGRGDRHVSRHDLDS